MKDDTMICSRGACGLLLLATLFLYGCARDLPQFTREELRSPCPIPQGAAPVLRWHGERTGLKTYWFDQDVFVEASAYIPSDWKKVGDERWEVSGRNATGRQIPFLGVVHSYLNENQVALFVIDPPVDLMQKPDGLYLGIMPQITRKDERVSSVAPVALLYEIRNHSFQPFRVRIPLQPEKVTELTPAPEWTPPAVPQGTPVPPVD